MNGPDKIKNLQISQILQIVKIANLFFAASAFFQYYFANNESNESHYSLKNEMILFLVLFSVLAV